MESWRVRYIYHFSKCWSRLRLLPLSYSRTAVIVTLRSVARSFYALYCTLCLETSLFRHIKRREQVTVLSQLSKDILQLHSSSNAKNHFINLIMWVMKLKKYTGSFLQRCSLHFKCAMEAQLAVCCKMAAKSLDTHCIISAAPGSYSHIINSSTHINTSISGLLWYSRGCLKLSFVVLLEIRKCRNTRLQYVYACMRVYSCLGLDHQHWSQCPVQISNGPRAPP